MRVIDPYVEVFKFDPDYLMQKLEIHGRVCYKSENRITPESAVPFLAGLIANGHLSVFDHCTISARFVVNRGVSHELVRHRIGAYSQESTRYCNYGKTEEGITFIKPFYFKDTSRYWRWLDSCQKAEDGYLGLLADGASPQEAREVLPNATKTEIDATYDITEWRHVFLQRCSRRAHPQMQQVMIPLLLYMREKLPVLFGDIPFNKSFPSQHYAEVREREI